VVVVEGS
jgi:hypothetical protein